MSICEYSDWLLLPKKEDDEDPSYLCKYCRKEMRYLPGERPIGPFADGDFRYISGSRVCDTCGWWIAHIVEKTVVFRDIIGSYAEGDICAILRKLDLSDISIPVDEVRNYLNVKYSD
jgi:hypothetical protein